jgi:hypothetical protein
MRIQIQGAKPMRIRILVKLSSHEKLNFFSMRNILVVGNRSKNVPTKVKSLFEREKPDLFVNIVQFSCSWIRIRVPNTDLDPGQPNECGSVRIRIHNTSGFPVLLLAHWPVLLPLPLLANSVVDADPGSGAFLIPAFRIPDKI